MLAIRQAAQARLAALLCATIALAVVLGALAFEHLGGYAPCPLCLEQRWPYYLGVPLAAGFKSRAADDGPTARRLHDVLPG